MGKSKSPISGEVFLHLKKILIFLSEPILVKIPYQRGSIPTNKKERQNYKKRATVKIPYQRGSIPTQAVLLILLHLI